MISNIPVKEKTIWVLAILNQTLSGCKSRQDMMNSSGWILFVWVFIILFLIHFCCWRTTTKLGQRGKSLCSWLITTRGSCAKWKAEGMGKEVWYSYCSWMFLCCLYCLTQPVCTLVRHIRWFILMIQSFMRFKTYKWKWTQHKCFGHCNCKRKRRNGIKYSSEV